MDFRLTGRSAVAQLASLLPRSLATKDAGATLTLNSQLTEMAAQHPRHAAETIAQHVGDIRRRSGNLRGQLRALEQVLFHANLVVNQLEKLLDESRLPLSSTSRIAASTGDRLLKQMAEAYTELAGELSSRWLRVVYGGALELATFRAVQLIHRRSQLALRAYATGSSRRWGLFIRLYRLARDHRFHRKAIEHNNEDTIESLVARNCLLAMADPASLSAGEMSWLRFYVDRHGASATFRSQAPSERAAAGLFVLNPKFRLPHRLSATHTLSDEELVFDCRPVLKKLKRQVVGLRRGMAPNRLELPLEASDPAYLFLLQRCGEQWTEPRTRRHGRNKFRPRADLVAGFESVRHFLGGSAFRRRASDQANGVGGGLSQASEWAILDQSPSGFGLRFVAGHAGAISVGELVTLRPREAATVHLCITRRARSVSNADFELGLELLGDFGTPATVTKTLENGHGVPIPALLLPRVPRLNNGPGLLAPMGEVTPGMALMVQHKGRMIRLEAQDVVECLASCELIRMQAARADSFE